MNKPTGGPAFPIVGTLEDIQEVGMTLRDYFAAQAITMVNMNNYTTMSPESRNDFIARSAYALADAMLKARER